MKSGIKLDIIIDKEMRNMAKYTGLILFTANFVILFPIILLVGIYNDKTDSLGMFILGLILFLSLSLMGIFLTISMRKKLLKKVLISEKEIQVLSSASKLLYTIDNKQIKKIKKVSLGVPVPGGGRIPVAYYNSLNAIAICCTEKEIEQAPKWNEYFKNHDFLFIENRPGLEELLNVYLPHVKIEDNN